MLRNYSCSVFVLLINVIRNRRQTINTYCLYYDMVRPRWEYNNSAHVSCLFVFFVVFFHLGDHRLSDYNSATVTVGHYEPACPAAPPPRVGNIISYLLAVFRSHVSEIHEGKIGNGTIPTFLISSLADCIRATS